MFVSESQLRTVIQQFRDRRVTPKAFPDRAEVPQNGSFSQKTIHTPTISSAWCAKNSQKKKRVSVKRLPIGTGFHSSYYRNGKRMTTGQNQRVVKWVKTSSLTPDEILTNFPKQLLSPHCRNSRHDNRPERMFKPIECVFLFFAQCENRPVFLNR